MSLTVGGSNQFLGAEGCVVISLQMRNIVVMQINATAAADKLEPNPALLEPNPALTHRHYDRIFP